MKKACVMLILSLVLIFGLMTAPRCSAAEIASGEADSWQWSLSDDGVLTISGSGYVECTYVNGAFCGLWYAFSDQIVRVVVEEGITGLSGDSLNGLFACTELELPASLEYLDCSDQMVPGLLTITVAEGNSNYTAEDGILMNADKTTILLYPCGRHGIFQIPDGVEAPASAFYGGGPSGFAVSPNHDRYSVRDGMLCSKDGKTLLIVPRTISGTLTIPAGMNRIEDYACAWCNEITDLQLPATVTYLGQGAFSRCNGLETVRLDGALKEVPPYCFYECSNLKTVILGEGTEQVGIDCFGSCEQLQEVVLPQTLKSLGGDAFEHCKGLEQIALPERLQSMDMSCFYMCTGLREISIPDGIVSIPYMCFEGCASLQTVSLPSGLQQIEDRSFYGTGIQDLLIPESVDIIAKNAFAGSKLTRIHFLGNCPQTGAQGLPDGAELCSLEGTTGWDSEALSSYTQSRWTYDYENTAACSVPGTIRYRCLHCGAEFTREDSGEHQLSAWFVQQAPTLTEEGTIARICSRCEYRETAPVPKRLPVEQTPMVSNNVEESRQRTLREGCLIANEDGTFTRVEEDPQNSGSVNVELYDRDFQFLSRIRLDPELPIYGGCYAGTDYNFLAFGDTNEEEDDNREVYRIVCYSKDWVRMWAVSLYGKNTVYPFRSGSMDMAQSGDVLYLRTSHLMYRSNDGYRHQANVTITVNIPQMRVLESRTDVSSSDTGYVSHSFNQRVLVDGKDLVCCDLGDAYPRALALLRCQGMAGKARLGSFVMVPAISIYGEIGNNYTGVDLSGFAASDTCYLVAGRSSLQTEEGFYGMRNVFVTATNKTDYSEESTQIHWFTNYPQDASIESITTPRLVKLSGTRFLLMWVDQQQLHYQFLDQDGNPTGAVYTDDMARISDVEPVVSGNRVVWYYTGNGKPNFCSIDLEHPETVTVLHAHGWNVFLEEEPTMTEGGMAKAVCAVCQETEYFSLPPRTDPGYQIEVWAEPDESNYGWYELTWVDPNYGAVSFTVWVRAHTHDFRQTSLVPPTATEPGERTMTCSFCGYRYTEILPPITLPCGDYCPGSVFTDMPAKGSWNHDPIDWAVVNGITSGTSATTFSPGNYCTRAEIVTFLWRAYGKQAPDSGENPFTDVPEKSWYTEPVLWAANHDPVITKGTGDGRFNVGAACTRAEVVTFLWRAAGCPEPVNSENPFTDVEAGSWYETAVLWAVENKITNGTSASTFAPGAFCTRSEVVTFLYRAKAE